MEQVNQVRSALLQAHDSLSTGDKIAAGIITVALVGLAVGATMALGGSGTKALTALAASPLLYLGVAAAYSKLISMEQPAVVEEVDEVVDQHTPEENLVLEKTTAITEALEKRTSVLSEEVITLIKERNEALKALPEHHSWHTEVKGQAGHNGFWHGGRDAGIVDAALEEVKKASPEKKEALRGQVKALFEAIGRPEDARFTFRLG